jgi:aerobic-type carbon monoxide dehydrogenase small subunit (CoxS/CutS family)
MINRSVNGTQLSVDAPEDMPLLWVLFGLTQARFDRTTCVACSVGTCSVVS